MIEFTMEEQQLIFPSPDTSPAPFNVEEDSPFDTSSFPLPSPPVSTIPLDSSSGSPIPSESEEISPAKWLLGFSTQSTSKQSPSKPDFFMLLNRMNEKIENIESALNKRIDSVESVCNKILLELQKKKGKKEKRRASKVLSSRLTKKAKRSDNKHSEAHTKVVNKDYIIEEFPPAEDDFPSFELLQKDVPQGEAAQEDMMPQANLAQAELLPEDLPHQAEEAQVVMHLRDFHTLEMLSEAEVSDLGIPEYVKKLELVNKLTLSQLEVVIKLLERVTEDKDYVIHV